MKLRANSWLFVFFFLFILPPLVSQAQNRLKPNLSVSLIPDSLINVYTHAVVRYDSTFVNVIKPDKVKITKRYAVTVLDKNGDNYGNLRILYSNLSDINHIGVYYYDAKGNRLLKLRKKDIEDVSVSSESYVFYSDNRAKMYRYFATKYPYTAVFTIKRTLNTTFFLPNWTPQRTPGCAVTTSKFKLQFPKAIGVRTADYQMPANLKKSKGAEGNIVSETWQLSGIKAVGQQPLSTTGNFNTPTLVLAATHFNLYGHKGIMDSWKDFGKFNYQLNNGRDVLDEQTVRKVKKIIRNDFSLYQKVQTLYDYMQANTRYMANEYGLAGWQTFPATYVCQKGYGDCKGLTNFMKSLLKAAGIKSYPVLVNAGTKNHHIINRRFPNNFFNHVILCIPDKKDSIWVECTSPFYNAGYLGGFTGNRYGLLCSKNGGTLVKTPDYGIPENYISHSAQIHFQPEKKQQQIQINNKYVGPQQDNLYQFLKQTPIDLIKKRTNQKLPFSSYVIKKYNYNFLGKPKLPEIEENFLIATAGMVNYSGKRTFIRLNWLPNPMKKIIQNVKRTKPLVLRKSFKIMDSVTLDWPANYSLDFSPSNYQVNYPFAELKITYRESNRKVTFLMKYIQHSGAFPITAFKKYQNLYRKLESAQRQAVVLVEK